MSETQYLIQYTASAARALRKIDKPQRKEILSAIEALVESPRPNGVKKLQGGSGEYRIRVGSYRVIYEIRDKQLVILVLKAGHRREIYR